MSYKAIIMTVGMGDLVGFGWLEHMLLDGYDLRKFFDIFPMAMAFFY